LIADSGGLAMGAGAADDVGDAGVYVVSGGTASASEPNTSDSAVDGAKVAFDTIVVSGATELLADTGGGTELVSSGVGDFGAQIAAGGITISAGVVVTVADVVTGGEMGGGLAVDGAEPFSARISSASAEFAPLPVWSAAAKPDLLAHTTLTVAGGGAAGATVSASSTNKVRTEGTEFGAAGKDDTMNMRSGDVVQDTVVGGGNVVGS
jgi:hypothetical protein